MAVISLLVHFVMFTVDNRPAHRPGNVPPSLRSLSNKSTGGLAEWFIMFGDFGSLVSHDTRRVHRVKHQAAPKQPCGSRRAFRPHARTRARPALVSLAGTGFGRRGRGGAVGGGERRGTSVGPRQAYRLLGQDPRRFAVRRTAGPVTKRAAARRGPAFRAAAEGPEKHRSDAALCRSRGEARQFGGRDLLARAPAIARPQLSRCPNRAGSALYAAELAGGGASLSEPGGTGARGDTRGARPHPEAARRDRSGGERIPDRRQHR